MNGPKISILVPVYNGERYIRETLESAYSQDYENTEVVIVDDASTDSSHDLVMQFSEGKDNVTVVTGVDNTGFCASVNRAVSYSNGDYFITLGQDDILQHDHVSKMLGKAGQSVAFVHCRPKHIDGDGNILDEASFCRNALLRLIKSTLKSLIRSPLVRLIRGPCISSTGLLVNRRFFDAVGGFDESYRNLGEYLLWVRLSRVGEIRFCPDVRPSYRVYPCSLIHQIAGGDDPESRMMTRYLAQCRQEAIGNPRLPAWSRLAIWPFYYGISLARSLRR